MTITRSVVLACDPERAFARFTEHAGRWWPTERRHTGDAASAIVIEPGGRFYERGADGREVELGAVLVFAPPVRLVLDWYPGTGPGAPTLVEVRFDSVLGGTRVTVTHGRGRAAADVFERSAPRFDESWQMVLDAFTRHAG